MHSVLSSRGSPAEHKCKINTNKLNSLIGLQSAPAELIQSSPSCHWKTSLQKQINCLEPNPLTKLGFLFQAYMASQVAGQIPCKIFQFCCSLADEESLCLEEGKVRRERQLESPLGPSSRWHQENSGLQREDFGSCTHPCRDWEEKMLTLQRISKARGCIKGELQIL